jgi:hypothetical protein
MRQQAAQGKTGILIGCIAAAALLLLVPTLNAAIAHRLAAARSPSVVMLVKCPRPSAVGEQVVVVIDGDQYRCLRVNSRGAYGVNK